MVRSKLIFLFFFPMMVFGCAHPQLNLSTEKIVDLTHPFDQGTIYWPTSKEFRLEKVFRGRTEKGFYYTANNFAAAEHGGTHIDAPIHFYENRSTVDRIPLRRLIGRGAIIDVKRKSAADRDYQVRVEDFLSWEEKHGSPLDGHIVLLRTGHGEHWPDRRKYMGTDQRGPQAVPMLHFPGLHPKAAGWLTSQRKVKAVGLDTPSIDYGRSTLFESHVILFEKDIPVFENLANLGELPERGFTVIALPMKIKGGSGGPLRIVALLP